jgi:hypothetical protein
MTHDELIELAKMARFFVKDSEVYSPSNQEDHELTPYLETFANLVAIKERENCAKVCDDLSDKHTWEGCYANECAEAIRAKGKVA